MQTTDLCQKIVYKLFKRFGQYVINSKHVNTVTANLQRKHGGIFITANWKQHIYLLLTLFTAKMLINFLKHPIAKELRTIALRYVARNLEFFWKEEWDPELQEFIEASDF